MGEVWWRLVGTSVGCGVYFFASCCVVRCVLIYSQDVLEKDSTKPGRKTFKCEYVPWMFWQTVDTLMHVAVSGKWTPLCHSTDGRRDTHSIGKTKMTTDTLDIQWRNVRTTHHKIKHIYTNIQHGKTSSECTVLKEQMWKARCWWGQPKRKVRVQYTKGSAWGVICMLTLPLLQGFPWPTQDFHICSNSNCFRVFCYFFFPLDIKKKFVKRPCKTEKQVISSSIIISCVTFWWVSSLVLWNNGWQPSVGLHTQTCE